MSPSVNRVGHRDSSVPSSIIFGIVGFPVGCSSARSAAQARLIAGTIFQGTKLPLTVWFQAMHLLTQGKHSVSDLELKRQLGLCCETAWNLKQKIMQILLEREEAMVLSDRVEVDDAYVGAVLQGRQASLHAVFCLAITTPPVGK